MVFVVTHLDGDDEVTSDLGVLEPLLDELENATAEQPDIAVTLPPDWSLGVDADGVVTWLDLEERGDQPFRRLEGLSRVELLGLMGLVAVGDKAAVDAYPWDLVVPRPQRLWLLEWFVLWCAGHDPSEVMEFRLSVEFMNGTAEEVFRTGDASRLWREVVVEEMGFAPGVLDGFRERWVRDVGLAEGRGEVLDPLLWAEGVVDAEFGDWDPGS